MKVTEKQLQVMYRVLEGSVQFYDNANTAFGYNRSTRLQILNQILNQQSDEIIDIKDGTRIQDNTEQDKGEVMSFPEE